MQAPAIRQAVYDLAAGALTGATVTVAHPGEDQRPRAAWISNVKSEFDVASLGPRPTNQAETVTVTLRIEAYAEHRQQQAAAAAALTAVDELAKSFTDALLGDQDLGGACLHAAVGELESDITPADSGWWAWWTVEVVANCRRA